MEVKTIFKTLFMVPVIIFICYFIFNVFAFALSYFRCMAVSQMVMQVVVENNYLPQQELNTLNSYIDNNIESMVLQDVHIVVGMNGNTPVASESSVNLGDRDARTRRQYGAEVECGVTAKFVIQWPLMPNQQANDGREFNDGQDGDFYKNDAELEQEREINTTSNNINIIFKVPGLKYYPDLLN